MEQYDKLSNVQLAEVIQSLGAWDASNAAIRVFLNRVGLDIDVSDDRKTVTRKIYNTLGLWRELNEGIESAVDLAADILGVDIYGWTGMHKKAERDRSIPFTSWVEVWVDRNEKLQEQLDAIDEPDSTRKLAKYTAALNRWFQSKIELYVGDDSGQASYNLPEGMVPLYNQSLITVDMVRVAKAEIAKRSTNRKEA